MSSRKRILSLILASGYAVVILSAALLVGNFLYEVSRMYSLVTHPLPNLEIGDATVDLPHTEISQTQANTGSQTPNTLLVDSSSLKQINVLILGTDERAGENGPPLTDTMLLLTLDLEHRTAGMLSLPRDLWVPIPGYDMTTKINTAYALGERRGYPGGGAQLAKDTVSSFIGRPIDHYVKIDFNGFVRFIDLIGGIEIHVPKTIHDDRYPTPDHGYETFHLDAGFQHLDGETALKYVRTRNVDSDYMRAGRQQQMIQTVLDKILAADMIPTLVAKAPQLMATMNNSFSTDVPLPTAIELANYMRHQSLQEPLRRLVLDDNYGSETYSDEGAWILVPDRDRIRQALGDFFEPPYVNVTESTPAEITLVTTGVSAAPPERVSRQTQSSVRLEILNGTGYPGVAARIRDLLQSDGWQVVSIGDADRSDYRRTLIVNYNADEALIEAVNADLNLPPNLPTLNGLIISDTVDMRIVVGQDFLTNVLNTTAP